MHQALVCALPQACAPACNQQTPMHQDVSVLCFLVVQLPAISEDTGPAGSGSCIVLLT